MQIFWKIIEKLPGHLYNSKKSSTFAAAKVLKSNKHEKKNYSIVDYFVVAELVCSGAVFCPNEYDDAPLLPG